MRLKTLVLIAASALSMGAGAQNHANSAASCSKPVYLTLDTGHMGVAEHIAQVLRRELAQWRR